MVVIDIPKTDLFQIYFNNINIDFIILLWLNEQEKMKCCVTYVLLTIVAVKFLGLGKQTQY